MNTPPAPSAAPDPIRPATPLPKPGKPWFLRGYLPWFFAGFVAVVLAGLSMPCFGCVQIHGVQTKALAQAHHFSAALRLFADDHEGHYPGQGFPMEMTEAPKNSNQAFACMFPTYIQSESIFGNKLSAYQTGSGPDNRIDDPYTGHPVQTLRPGENVYGYVAGLTESSAPWCPLMTDGTDGTGHYVSDQHRRGGVWGGTKAVVIYLDGSGALENLRGPVDARYIPRRDDPGRNALDADYLGKEARYLDPAVAGR